MKQYNYRFSPPYGDGIDFFLAWLWIASFRPLTGMYTKYITKHRKTEEPDGWKMFTLLQ